MMLLVCGALVAHPVGVKPLQITDWVGPEVRAGLPARPAPPRTGSSGPKGAANAAWAAKTARTTKNTDMAAAARERLPCRERLLRRPAPARLAVS